MKIERKSFTFFESFYTAASSLSDKQRLTFYETIITYALYGKEPELKGTTHAMFELVKPILNKGISCYKNGSEPKAKRKRNGSETEANTKPTGSETEPTSHENRNRNRNIDKDKDIEKEIEKEKDNDIDVCEKEKESKSHEQEAEQKPEAETNTHTNRPDPNSVFLEANSMGANMSVSDVADFMAYNDASGWKLDWKYALKRWVEKSMTQTQVKKLKNDVSESHDYNMDELRKRAKA